MWRARIWWDTGIGGRITVITYEEAVRIVDRYAKPMPSKRVDIALARGQFLAEDLVARYDSPPFHNSAVDGFGRRSDDLDARKLRLVAKIRAGGKGNVSIGKRSE